MNRMTIFISHIYHYDFTKLGLSTTILRFSVINLSMFLIPLIFDQPQIVIGSIINFLLIYIAFNFKNNELLPAIFLPAMATVLRGALLGSSTPFLIFLMPLIWIANAIFVMSLRYFAILNWKIEKTLILSAILKAGVLFSLSLIVIKALALPEVLFLAMGPMQLLTAAIGSAVYMILQKKK